MKTYEIKIKSTSPLLMHGSYALGMEEKKTQKKKGGDALVGDPEEWKKTIYFDSKIGLYLPSINLEASWISAGVEFKVGKGKKSAKEYIKAGVFINDNEIVLIVNGKPIIDIDKVEIDKRTVKNPSTKGRNMRYRAIIRDWSASFKVTVSADDYISKDLLSEIMSYSGRFVGVGDFRPRFGRYELVSIKEVSI